MNDWTPKPIPSSALAKLPLTAEEGFVLSRLDGSTPVRHLPALTGLPPERIQAILTRLVAHGAVLPAPTPAPMPPPAVPAPRTGAASEEELPTGSEEPLPVEEEEEEAPGDAPAEAAAGNWRQLFERQLHPLPEDERASRARAAEDPELSAFCFDPVPAVIKSVLENTRVGLPHARLIARHHHNPVGLEALCGRAAFASDAGVRRWLVRNPQLPSGLFRRLWSGRRLLEQYKVTMDRDVPEGTRRTAREVMRTRFNTAPAEERVELILHTEGRVLASLVGLAVDGKTAALLCGRTYRSPMLIQNIARWSAAPPALIAHLLKQEAVRRQPQLRLLLQRHPNAPADARRGG
ncbi:hypothetical protein [Archangium sp.]|uniref:hypothetical protein n=1 Tax=Archangium sp. TaxID=1872627 RepID=UPI002D3D1498|nr:hypothetical protein [Archangium sp.]HYO55963.1 hypothetical protein [Archangium sp.]